MRLSLYSKNTRPCLRKPIIIPSNGICYRTVLIVARHEYITFFIPYILKFDRYIAVPVYNMTYPTVLNFTLIFFHICMQNVNHIKIQPNCIYIHLCAQRGNSGTIQMMRTVDNPLSEIFVKLHLRNVPTQTVSRADLWYVRCCYPDNAFEQTIEQPVIWNASYPMQRHCDVYCYKHVLINRIFVWA